MGENRPKITAFIPVRGGSKGLPNKNRAELGSHPLMAWSILAAKMTPEVAEVIVSTDDSDLKKIAIDYGADVVPRPPELATDNVGLFDVIMHFRDQMNSNKMQTNYMLLLEATSPFRSLELMKLTCNKLQNGFDSVATFKKAHTHPLQSWKISEQQIETYIPGANPWVRRQDLAPAYELSGEIYGFNIDKLSRASDSLLVGKTFPLIVDEKLSVDINDDADLQKARALFDKSPLVEMTPRSNI